MWLRRCPRTDCYWFARGLIAERPGQRCKVFILPKLLSLWPNPPVFAVHLLHFIEHHPSRYLLWFSKTISILLLRPSLLVYSFQIHPLFTFFGPRRVWPSINCFFLLFLVFYKIKDLRYFSLNYFWSNNFSLSTQHTYRDACSK